MQFNLVNDQEQVAQFVRRGVRGMAWRYSLLVFWGGWLQHLWGGHALVQLYQGVFGQF